MTYHGGEIPFLSSSIGILHLGPRGAFMFYFYTETNGVLLVGLLYMV